MAIELPQPVVDFLRVIGVNWPQVNEDTVREFADHVRQFASDIDGTHSQASGTVQQLGQSYQGKSYELLVSKWAALSKTHMTALLDACKVLAEALDVAADVIVGLKVEAIAELVVLAATFVADQAAAVATFGLAEAALPAIEEAGTQLVKALEQTLIQEIENKVIEAALNPLLDLVQKAASGINFQSLEDMLGVGGGGGGGDGGAGTGYSMDTEAVTAHAAVFRQYGQDVAAHAQTLTTNIAGLNFS